MSSGSDCKIEITFLRLPKNHFSQIALVTIRNTTMPRDIFPEWFDVSLSVLIQQGLVEETDEAHDGSGPKYRVTSEGVKRGKQALEVMYKGELTMIVFVFEMSYQTILNTNNRFSYLFQLVTRLPTTHNSFTCVDPRDEGRNAVFFALPKAPHRHGWMHQLLRRRRTP